MVSAFLKRVFYFSIILCVGLLIGGAIQEPIIKSAVYSPESFRLPNDIDVLFIGDSHAKCAFNDSVINQSYNASHNSESIFQTYNKLKYLLRVNPEIRLVVLSFGAHNIAGNAKKGILYGDKYFPILDSSSRELIINAEKYGLLNKDNTLEIAKHRIIVSFLRYKWTIGLPMNMNKYWNFLISDTANSNSLRLSLHPLFSLPYRSVHSNLTEQTISKALKRHFGNNCQRSDKMINYLIRIINLCKEKHIRLFLINTPQYNLYRDNIPECQKYKYNKLIDSLLQYNPQLLYYKDYSNLELPDTLYGDGDHLNYYGNTVFSGMIKDEIYKLLTE